MDTEADGAAVDRLQEEPLTFAVRAATTDAYGVVRKGRHALRCATCSRKTCPHTAALEAVASRDGFAHALLLPAAGDDEADGDGEAHRLAVSQRHISFPFAAVPDPSILGEDLFAASGEEDVCSHGNPWSPEDFVVISEGW